MILKTEYTTHIVQPIKMLLTLIQQKAIKTDWHTEEKKQLVTQKQTKTQTHNTKTTTTHTQKQERATNTQKTQNKMKQTK